MRTRRKRLKLTAVLPSAITLLNGFFGFLAILIASYQPGLDFRFPLLPEINMSYPAICAWLIILSMVADGLDGGVARASGYTSKFGSQLDSLCDTVSFGVAPALLSYKMLAVELEQLRGAEFRFVNMTGRWVLFVAIFYAMCALTRLARFNVETTEDEASHMNFSGLPSPAAAGLVISLVLFHEKIAYDSIARMSFISASASAALERISLWAIPFALMLAGVLMVSRVTYPHVVNQLMRSKSPFPILILAIFVGMLAIWTIDVSLLLCFLSFFLYGLIRWVVKALKRKRRAGRADHTDRADHAERADHTDRADHTERADHTDRAD